MDDLGIIESGAVMIRGDRIVWIGSTKNLPIREPKEEHQILDAVGLGVVALPGFVDSHTHPVFAGLRAGEYEMRARGKTYQERGGLMQVFFGDRIAGYINLAAQVLILIGLWIGFYFARRKKFKQHSAIQTSMVLANMFFILTIMVTSFYSYVIRGGTTGGTIAYLMIFHGFVGTLAELTGIYLILRMNTSLIPPKLRVKNFKLVMRSRLGLWIVGSS